MDRSLKDGIGSALGAEVRAARPLGGGDINDAAVAELADGQHVFVKWNRRAPGRMFETEARGLAWLDEAGALRVPRVLAVGADASPPFLVLELLEPGRRRRDFDEVLGRGLAALHRFGAAGFGLDHDNFIGRLPQVNDSRDDWPTFYRECRLEPQLRMAAERGLASGAMKQGFERLFATLEALVGPPEPAARLHGDLWGGNLHVAPDGEPALIDPAVYGGHREMDLAMMRLFGGFGPRVFSAYEEAYPLATGHDERVALYQLYPLMVHVNLFGGTYVSSVERALGRIV